MMTREGSAEPETGPPLPIDTPIEPTDAVDPLLELLIDGLVTNAVIIEQYGGEAEPVEFRELYPPRKIQQPGREGEYNRPRRRQRRREADEEYETELERLKAAAGEEFSISRETEARFSSINDARLEAEKIWTEFLGKLDLKVRSPETLTRFDQALTEIVLIETEYQERKAREHADHHNRVQGARTKLGREISFGYDIAPRQQASLGRFAHLRQNRVNEIGHQTEARKAERRRNKIAAAERTLETIFFRCAASASPIQALQEELIFDRITTEEYKILATRMHQRLANTDRLNRRLEAMPKVLQITPSYHSDTTSVAGTVVFADMKTSTPTPPTSSGGGKKKGKNKGGNQQNQKKGNRGGGKK